MCTIRPETPADFAAVCEINRQAFGREVEVRLVERLRESPGHIPELSLVAERDGAVVGHILFSPIAIEMGAGRVPTLMLAPLAVRPEHQRQGIGSQLVRAGLEACARLGHTSVIVVGHGSYYPRFGFVRARPHGLETAFECPDEAFMLIELVPGALDGVRGTIRLSAAFEGL